jgi:hypothetical protein
LICNSEISCQNNCLASREKNYLNNFHTQHIFQTEISKGFIGWVSLMYCSHCVGKKNGFNFFTQIIWMGKIDMLKCEYEYKVIGKLRDESMKNL